VKLQVERSIHLPSFFTSCLVCTELNIQKTAALATNSSVLIRRLLVLEKVSLFPEPTRNEAIGLRFLSCMGEERRLCRAARSAFKHWLRAPGLNGA